MNFQHQAFAPYQQQIAALALADGFPQLGALNALAAVHGLVNARHLPLRFTAPNKPLAARDYERHILQTGCIPTRPDNWHDVMNALVWLRFPLFKAALNAAHGEAIDSETGSLRGRRRDALTMLDESGVWVVARDAALIDALRQRRWRHLFWEHREAARTQIQWIVVGHALLEKMLKPYLAVTGKCLLLHADTHADCTDPDRVQQLARLELNDISAPHQLAPLPLLGIPEWHDANVHAVFYDNQAVFRDSPY